MRIFKSHIGIDLYSMFSLAFAIPITLPKTSLSVGADAVRFFMQFGKGRGNAANKKIRENTRKSTKNY